MNALMKIVKWMLFNHIQSLYSVAFVVGGSKGGREVSYLSNNTLFLVFIVLYFNFRTKFHYLEGEL